MSQEMNDENTYLECDLVLCRNMNSEKGGLEAFEMWIWRRMEKISWTEPISNEEMLNLVEEERSLLTIIRTRQWNWMRHIMRGDPVQREIIEGRMAGKTGRGRPRQKLLDWIIIIINIIIITFSFIHKH